MIGIRVAMVVAGAAFAAQLAYAANPQPYEVEWSSSGDKAVDSTLDTPRQRHRDGAGDDPGE